MSQYDFGTIDPYVVDGVQLASMLNNWRDALYTMQRGPTRPGFVVPGMVWVDDSAGATAWQAKLYLGPTLGDIVLYSIDTTTGLLSLNPTNLTGFVPISGGEITGNLIVDGELHTPAPPAAENSDRVPNSAWVRALIASGGSRCVVSNVAPPGAQGVLWWNDELGVLYLWYDDSSSQQWVPASPPSPAPAGSILQVQSVTKTDTFTSAATAFSDVTGMSLAITPRNANSRFIIHVGLGIAVASPTYSAAFQILRNGTPINIPPVVGSRPRANFEVGGGSNADHGSGAAYHTVDVPGSAAAITYKLQVATQSGSTVYINRTANDSDGTDPYQSRTASTFTVMEVAG